MNTTLFDTPDLYLVEYAGDNAFFARMSREGYRNSIFTDRQRIKAQDPTPIVMSLSSIVRQYEVKNLQLKPMNFIFHTANCGSTLLARALDLPGRNLVHREPYPLRQVAVEMLASLKEEANLPIEKHRLIRLILALLGRTYGKTEKVIVKANIPVNYITPHIFGLLPDSPSILLYSDLRSFLLSVLKTPDRRKWVTHVVKEVSNGITSVDKLSSVNLDNSSCPKLAASLWVSQICKYSNALKVNQNARSLSSEDFFSKPAEILHAAFKHFQLDVSNEEIKHITNSQVFSRYSKDPRFEYTNDTRKRERERLLQENREEVEEGLNWGESLIEQCGISGILQRSLV